MHVTGTCTGPGKLLPKADKGGALNVIVSHAFLSIRGKVHIPHPINAVPQPCSRQPVQAPAAQTPSALNRNHDDSNPRSQVMHTCIKRLLVTRWHYSPIHPWHVGGTGLVAANDHAVKPVPPTCRGCSNLLNRDRHMGHGRASA